MPIEPSWDETFEAPPDAPKWEDTLDAPPEPVGTGEGLLSSLRRGLSAAANIPSTVLSASLSDLSESPKAQYRAERLTRSRVMDALLEAGQDTEAQQAAYFKSGPEALIRETQRDIIKPVVTRMAESEALPRSEAQTRLAKAGTGKDKFVAWLQDPVELTTSIILESLPASLAGAAVGASVGPPGMIAGVGASSGLATFSSELFGNAAARGVDIRDVDAVTEWLNSKEFDEDFSAARTKSTIVAGIDAVTAGKAGSFIAPAIKQGLKKAATASAKEVAMQAAGGAGGEAFGSLAAGKEIEPFDVFAEAIAEVGSAPGEVGGNLMRSRQPSTGRVAPPVIPPPFFTEAPAFEETTASPPPMVPAEPPVTEVVAPPIQQASTSLRPKRKGKKNAIQVVEAAPLPVVEAPRDSAQVVEEIRQQNPPVEEVVTQPPAPIVAPAASEIEVLETLEGEGALSKTQKARLKELRKAPAIVPVPEVVAPVVDLADQVAAMTGPEFSTWAKAQPGGFTTAAYEYGKTLTPEQQVKVREASAAVDSQVAEAVAAEDLQGMADLTSKKQFFNEALEAASGATLAKTKTTAQVKKSKGKKVDEPAARTLDTSGTTAYGSAFHIVPPPPILAPKQQKGWWTTNIGTGSGDVKGGESQKTVVLRNSETNELREVSAWNNNGEKVIDPDTGKATTAFNKESKRGLFNKGLWVPVIALRHSTALKGINRPITEAELVELKSQYESSVTGLPEVEPAAIGAQAEGELVEQPGITVVTKEALKAKPKPTEKPAATQSDAEALFDAIGQPNWEGEADGKDVILSALETSNSKQVAGYMKSLLDWIRLNNLDTATELYNFIGKVYESFERNKQAVVDGALAPEAYRAAVSSDIATASRRSVRPGTEVQTASEESGDEAGADVPSGDTVEDRPPAADLGPGLPEGQGMTVQEVSEAIAIEDDAGVPIQIITREQAEQIYKGTGGYSGFSWRGRAYLVADNIPDAAYARAVLREEVAHTLLDSEGGAKLLNSLIASSKLNLTPEERAALAAEGYTSDKFTEEQLLNEFIAKSARENRTWWQKAVASIRALLNRLGLKQLTNEETARILLAQIRSMGSPGAPIGTVAKAPSPSAAPKSFEDQANNEDPPLPDDKWVPTNVQGETFYVPERDRLTPESFQTSLDVARRVLTEAGFPATLRTFTDPVDKQQKSIFLIDKTVNADLKGRALAVALEREIAESRTQGKGADHVAALINSVRENFDRTDSALADMSESVRNRLFAIAQEQASFLGRALRALRNFRFDVVRTGRNVDVMLNRIYSDAFGGAQVRTVMDRVSAAVRARFSEDEVNSIVAKLNDPNEQAQLAAAIRRALAGDFSSGGDVVAATRAALIEGGMTEEQANTTVNTAGPAIESSVKKVGQSVAKDILGSLTPAEKVAVGGKNWKTVEELIRKGVFDDVEALKALANKRGWRVPSRERIKEMKDLADEVQKLTELTPAEEAAAGGDPAKIAALKMAKEATYQERGFKKQKKLATMWSEMTLPTSLNKFWADDVRANNARFINELISANLLAKPSFFTKQTWDILTQWVWRMPHRALAQALERHVAHKNRTAQLLSAIAQQQLQNGKPQDIAKLQADLARHQSQPADFWKEAAMSFKGIYGDSIRGLMPALVKARAAFAGRIETRNVDRLMSSVGALDRLWQRGEALAAQGDWFGAFIHRAIAAVGISYRIAGSLDFVHGLPAEINHRRHRVILGLRNAGFTRSEAEVQADLIFNTNKAEVAEAMAMAKSLSETDPKQFSEPELREAALNIIERRQFQKINELGLDSGAIREDAALYRNTLGWNERETRGFGGLIGTGVTGVGRILEQAGLPLPLGRFGNAIAIGINRNMQRTALYALSNKNWLGSKDSGQPSPWFRTQTDINERRIEAASGSLLGGIMVGIAFSGLAKVWMKPPIDKEERDLWDKEGHKAGTVEFQLGDSKAMVFSLTTGPMALFAPYFAAGGALNDLATKQEKAQARLNAEAARLGLTPGIAPGPDITDWFGVALAAAQASALGTRTSSGLFYSVTDYGTPNIKRFIASQFSPILPGLPAMQEVSRMSGTVIDPKKASLWDMIVPLPTSPARKVNMLGDSVGTESDVQRVFQTLSGGSYPLLDTKQGRSTAAYAALFASGYRPPSINPAQGYQMGNEFRPLNEAELAKYTELRGQYLKQNLGEFGPAADEGQARAAFNEANRQALSDVGVTTASAGRGSGGAGTTASAFGPRVTGRTSSVGLSVPRRTSGARIGIGGNRIRVSAGSLRPSRRLGGTRLPRIRAPRVTRVTAPRTRTRRARRNRLRR